MRKNQAAAIFGVFVVTAAAVIVSWHARVEGQAQPTSIAAIPSEKGGQDVFGGYDAAAWPKPLTSIKGH